MLVLLARCESLRAQLGCAACLDPLAFILEVGHHALELRKCAIEPDDGTGRCNLDRRVALRSFSLDDVAKPRAQAPNTSINLEMIAAPRDVVGLAVGLSQS